MYTEFPATAARRDCHPPERTKHKQEENAPFKSPRWIGNQLPVNAAYCCLVRGTTESLPSRTRGEPAKSLSAFTCANVHGFAIGFPALILTMGTFGSDGSTEITVAVPTAL